MPRVDYVVSDEGYSVEISKVRYPAVTIRYQEGPRVMDVWSEAMYKGDVNFVLDPSTTSHWAPPHETEAIGDAARELILQRIQAALLFAGFRTDRYDAS